jgi:hypothetical protein
MMASDPSRADERPDGTPPTRVFGTSPQLYRRPGTAGTPPVEKTPVRPRRSERTLRASAPRMDVGSRIPVAGAMSALGWPAGDVYARVQGQTMVVTLDPRPFATRASIDSRARLIVSPPGRSALAVTAGDQMLVVTVAATDQEAAHLVVSSLDGVAAEFLTGLVDRRD